MQNSVFRHARSDVVVVHRLPGRVTMMEEEDHHSLEDPSPALPPLRDLLADRLHADVRRQLAFASWSVDGGWEGWRNGCGYRGYRGHRCYRGYRCHASLKTQ